VGNHTRDNRAEAVRVDRILAFQQGRQITGGYIIPGAEPNSLVPCEPDHTPSGSHLYYRFNIHDDDGIGFLPVPIHPFSRADLT
jgi:hypothetical protein